MTYYLTLSYDENKDEFFAFVDDGTDTKDMKFSIDDTQEMIDLIKTNVMTHIDDVDGLLMHLRRQQILTEDDTILLNAEVLI